MILVIISGIYTSALLTTATSQSVVAVKDDIDARLMVAANAGFEYLRTQLYYESPEQFIGWTDQANWPDPPTSMLDANGDWVINDAVVTFEIVGVPNRLDAHDIRVTATRGDRFVIISRGVEMGNLDMYSFANNGFDDSGHLGTPQTWYGNLYWYSDNGTLVHFDGHQTFVGTLQSWQFGANQPDARYDFFDANGNPINEDHVHTEYDWNNSNDRAAFQPFDHGLDLDKKFSHNPGDLGYRETADYKFIHGNGNMPQSAELFLSPDGNIWWRELGGGTGDWALLGPQDGTVVYLEKFAVVRGVVTGKMTIAADEDIIVNGNIIRANDDTAALGLMAHDDIYWENRKEYTSGNQTKIANRFDNDQGASDKTWMQTWNSYDRNGTTVSNNPQDPDFIAAPVIGSDTPGALLGGMAPQAFMNAYPEFADQWTQWNGADAGNVPADAVIEASQFAGDTMGPALPFHVIQYKLGSNAAMAQIYHNRNGNTSWRSGGTYFYGSTSWYDYVENWDGATYGEHPNARFVRPPDYLVLESGEANIRLGSYEVIHGAGN